jgi:hypothetical protein
MDSKKALNVGIVALGILVSAIVLGVAYTGNDSPTQADTIQSIPIEERSGYKLQIYGGRVGVFRTTSDTPYTYLDVELSCLSDYDLQLLTNGIEVSTEQELNSLIEDLTS